MFTRRRFIAALIATGVTPTAVFARTTDFLLAQNFVGGVDVTRYLISEKLDGVRAMWDGERLRTRTGRTIAAPEWFVAALPNVALDGELWMGRGKFDLVSGVVRRTVNQVDAAWREVSFNIFELPGAAGPFRERAQEIDRLVKSAGATHIRAVQQNPVKSQRSVDDLLRKIVRGGGEGVILHRADAQYQTGRSEVLLKYKRLHDAEAVVVGHTRGRGKHKSRLGALEVEMQNGIRFRLGTGLPDAVRDIPPAIGSTITFTYADLTPQGKPRFARYLRAFEE